MSSGQKAWAVEVGHCKGTRKAPGFQQANLHGPAEWGGRTVFSIEANAHAYAVRHFTDATVRPVILDEQGRIDWEATEEQERTLAAQAEEQRKADLQAITTRLVLEADVVYVALSGQLFPVGDRGRALQHLTEFPELYRIESGDELREGRVVVIHGA